MASVQLERGALQAATFIGHGELADAAFGIDELAEWAARSVAAMWARQEPRSDEWQLTPLKVVS